jgi:hypothetical protein
MKLFAEVFIAIVLIAGTGEAMSQSVAPVEKPKGAYAGLGMHGYLSISQENTSVAGISAHFGWLWKKFGLSVSPEFNGFQFQGNEINSGIDFSATFLAHYRVSPRVALAAGPNVQVTQKVTNKEEWDTVSDISIMAGLGKNWPVGPLHLNLSGLFKYNPSASDFSIGADISLNYPF